MRLLAIQSSEDIQRILGSASAVLFKHSPTCGTSAYAYEEVDRFAAERNEVPVYIVDVIAQRPLSREIEARVGIRHESPQVFVIREGRVVWSASHYSITARKMELAMNKREVSPQ